MIKPMFFVVGLMLLFSFGEAVAQEKKFNRSSFLRVEAQEVKEDANFGLVFRGAGISYGMRWENKTDKKLLFIEYDLGVKFMFSRGIPGIGFYLKPIEVSQMFGVSLKGKRLYFGPFFKAEYNYFLYPDLQAGFDYWLSHFSIGPNLSYSFGCKNSLITLNAGTTILGLTSRQPFIRNPYYYDLGFKHALKHLHQDIRFGSFNRFNSTRIELLWQPNPEKEFGLGYALNFTGYYRAPVFAQFCHSLKLAF